MQEPEEIMPRRRELPEALQGLEPAPLRGSAREIWFRAGLEAGRRRANSWRSAATAAILAAFAATTAALATSHLTQSTLIRIKANDDWSYYQAKSIKASILEAKIYSAEINKVEPRKADRDKKADYAREMPEIQSRARDLEKLARAHLETHETYEGSATLFHIAIAIVAIAVVARRRTFWYLSIGVGVVGVFFFVKALVSAPPRLQEEKQEAAANLTLSTSSEPESPSGKP